MEQKALRALRQQRPTWEAAPSLQVRWCRLSRQPQPGMDAGLQWCWPRACFRGLSLQRREAIYSDRVASLQWCWRRGTFVSAHCDTQLREGEQPPSKLNPWAQPLHASCSFTLIGGQEGWSVEGSREISLNGVLTPNSGSVQQWPPVRWSLVQGGLLP